MIFPNLIEGPTLETNDNEAQRSRLVSIRRVKWLWGGTEGNVVGGRCRLNLLQHIEQ